ncbi:hypothetical protein SteCoe_17632 [Stentor coeruleus]|uniref:Uncharacterized protein n=1 Tax=Stentor coeruleus TaxID=5963 RepID=A0A1R2BYD2_9CILI|nr:hypothetical protein SteCoe_17632 [Stentor coeruleus]
MAYYKLGTRMLWWERHSAYKRRGMLDTSIMHELMLIYPPEQGTTPRPPFPPNWLTDYSRLLRKLNKRRPETRDALGKPNSFSHKFLTRQLYWMRNGHTEESAFNKTEEELAKNLVEARQNAALLYEVGSSTSMKSFMDYYGQVAEYEGRLKVKKLIKDLPKFLRGSKEMNIFNEYQHINEWEHLTNNIASSEETKTEPKKTFLEKAKTLINYHDEKASKYDGLQGLSDDLIIWTARDAYRHIKKFSKKLLSKLETSGVSLDANGELDVSKIKNKNLQDAIKKNPMIKMIFYDSFKDQYENENEDNLQETEGSYVPGPLSEPTIKWKSEDPYKQIYGRLKPTEIESQDERIERLKRLWHHSRKSKTEEDQFALQKEAVKALRLVRMKVDQVLVSEGKSSIFPKNMEYSRKELLLTHRLDIDRMGKFLSANPDNIFETEQDKQEYEEIKLMIEQKTIVEDTEPVAYDSSKGSWRSTTKDEDEDEDHHEPFEMKSVESASFEEFTNKTKMSNIEDENSDDDDKFVSELQFKAKDKVKVKDKDEDKD